MIPKAGAFNKRGWKKIQDVMSEFDRRLRRLATRALQDAGEELADDIKLRILEGKGMSKLHPWNIPLRGYKGEPGNRPLLSHGDLLNSIAVRSAGPLAATVGVHRGAMMKNGEDIANIAVMNEEGASLKITDRMRGFLRARGLRVRSDKSHIRIPARPFVGPGYRDFRSKRQGDKIIGEMVTDLLRGKG